MSLSGLASQREHGNLEPVFITGECRMDEDFSCQTRRFSTAILMYGKGKRRSMAIGAPAKAEFSWGEEEGMERA